MTLLYGLSVCLEVVIVILALDMVFKKKRYIGVAWAVTFGIYIFYDLAKTHPWGIPGNFLDTIFFIATFSALMGVYHLARKRG